MDIDYALLADHAEVLGGKLYLMGGGWDTTHAPEAPASARLVVAIGVRIEWDETNQPIALALALQDDDGQELVRAEGQVQVGRPPALPPGASQLSQTVVVIQAQLPAFGGYRVRLTARTPAGEERSRTLPFRLVQRPVGS